MQIYVNHDHSLKMLNTKLCIRLSSNTNNQLYFNENGVLCTNVSSVSGTYKPLNGIYGTEDAFITNLKCNSSVSRLASYNDTAGDLYDAGRQGDADLDGVNLPNLLSGILGEDVGITWWTKSQYIQIMNG